MQQDQKMDRSWRFSINLSGVAAPTGRKNLEVPEGYYKVMVSDAYINPERNKNRVVFKLTVTEGPFTGAVRTTGMNMPTGAEDNVRHYWRGLAESTGYSATELDAGEIELGVDTFTNREGYIHFVPKSDDSQWEKVDFLSPVEWTQQSQAFELRSSAAPTGPMGSVLGGSNGAGKPMTGTTSKSDVLAKLGINAK